MHTILIVVHVFLSAGLITLILMQHGKGADAGAAFGSGASATVFGAQGSANFLSRTTAILAALFFVTSLGLGYYSMQAGKGPGGLMEGLGDAPSGLMSSEEVHIPGADEPAPPGIELRSTPPSTSEVPEVEGAPVTPAVAPVEVIEVPDPENTAAEAAAVGIESGDQESAPGESEAAQGQVEDGTESGVTPAAVMVPDSMQGSEAVEVPASDDQAN